jgi:predicted secreted protein
MAKALGNTKKAYIKVGSSYTWLGGEQSNSLNRTAEAVEISDKSTDWAQFIAGKKGATVEITVFADPAESAQNNALTALAAGTVVNWAVGTISGSSVSAGDYGSAIITAISDTNDFGGVASRTISLTVTGAVTHV